jgi:hypothetical protein
LNELASRGSLFITRPSLMAYMAKREDLEASAKSLFGVVGSGEVKIDIRQRYALADVRRPTSTWKPARPPAPASCCHERAPGRTGHKPDDDGDFTDLLSETRILLPGAQMLSAFLIILPFNTGFSQIVHWEKQLFLATFLFSLASLVLLSAPAIQHRLMRPLKDRAHFKRVATREIVAGAFALAIALVLGTTW